MQAPMQLISYQETRRLFGPLNRPNFNTNVRHRAILRKALELFTPEELQEIFGRPIKLRVAMGSAFTFSEMGKVKTNYVRTLPIELPPTQHPDTPSTRSIIIASYLEKPPLPI